MAKTSAPLLSFGARGTVAKTVTFSSWRGVQYARQRVIPANPRSPGQQATRGTFSWARELVKVAPALLMAPWTAYATGRPFTADNAIVGEAVKRLRDDPDLANLILSPGARGGPPPMLVEFDPGSSEGEIDVAFTMPTPPTGWTLLAVVACALPDQEPAGVFEGPIIAAENDTTFDTITLTGFGAAQSCFAAGWAVWEKPNGLTAFSASIGEIVAAGS